MTELAAIEIVTEGDDRIVATVLGEVDASNADRVLEALQGALTAPALTIDLTRLRYVDSAGVRALYTVADTATLRGAGVTVVVPRDSPVRRVLVLSGVERVLALVEPGAAAV